MKRCWIIASLIGFLGCDDPASWGKPGDSVSVIDGARTPDEFEFEINRLEINAVGGNVVIINDILYLQGCSGTLVGDRLVATAAHCLIFNVEEWLNEGADADIFHNEHWRFAVGDDISDPECLFHAQSFHLHPEAVNVSEGLDHDMALVVLKESAVETCPSSVPLQVNWEQITNGMIGEKLLQGGFGSLNGTYDFSPIRYWSFVGLDSYVENHLTVVELGDGFPTFGDSGSGVLRRFDDGSLRVMGVESRYGINETMMLFTRLDSYFDFVETIATEELICGPVDEAGMCVDEFLVACEDHGFISIDCTLEDCAPNCACLCDTTDECDADCACDEDCPLDTGVNTAGGGGNDDCSITGGPGAKKGKPPLLALFAWVF